jgi:hypothetical protein
MFMRLESGEDKRLSSKDWGQFWVTLVRGMLVVFELATQSQVCFGFLLSINGKLTLQHLSNFSQPKPVYVTSIDLSNLQWRPASKDETKKKFALLLETAAKTGYLLRAEEEADYVKWSQATAAACGPASAEEAELVARLKDFSAFVEAQGDQLGKKESKSSWRSMGGLFAGLASNKQNDASPPSTRKPLPGPPPPQIIPPEACFGGRLVDQVAKQQRPIPYIVETCVREVEASGLQSEGIYRLSGNAADVQRLKALFNSREFGILPCC